MLGGKPDSRLQGCRFLTLTETNPKTEEGGEGGKAQRHRNQEVTDAEFRF